MTCEKCNNEFNPRKDTDVEASSGYGDTVELSMECPHCKASYSTWVEPHQWSLQEAPAH